MLRQCEFAARGAQAVDDLDGHDVRRADCLRNSEGDGLQVQTIGEVAKRGIGPG
jgi:hypothetical protein